MNLDDKDLAQIELKAFRAGVRVGRKLEKRKHAEDCRILELQIRESARERQFWHDMQERRIARFESEIKRIRQLCSEYDAKIANIRLATNSAVTIPVSTMDQGQAHARINRDLFR